MNRGIKFICISVFNYCANSRHTQNGLPQQETFGFFFSWKNVCKSCGHCLRCGNEKILITSKFLTWNHAWFASASCAAPDSPCDFLRYFFFSFVQIFKENTQKRSTRTDSYYKSNTYMEYQLKNHWINQHRSQAMRESLSLHLWWFMDPWIK